MTSSFADLERIRLGRPELLERGAVGRDGTHTVVGPGVALPLAKPFRRDSSASRLVVDCIFTDDRTKP